MNKTKTNIVNYDFDSDSDEDYVFEKISYYFYKIQLKKLNKTKYKDLELHNLYSFLSKSKKIYKYL